jgi:aquaporin NIP
MAFGEDLMRRMVAEAIGTFILVFAGVGAILTLSDEIGAFSYIFGFGIALMVIVYAIGHISGAHVNPAVTLGLSVTGRFPMLELPYYWVSQVAGALVAAITLRLLYGNENGLGVTSVAGGYSVLDGFVLELIAAAIFTFVITAIATDKRAEAAVAGLAIGGTLLVIHVFAGGVSGASVNPARSLGPAIVDGDFSDLWVYLTAPFIGGVIGAVLYEFIRGDGDRPPGEAISPSDIMNRFRPQPRNQPLGGGDSGRPRRQRRPEAPLEPEARPRRQTRAPQPPVYEDEFAAEDVYEEELPPVRPQRQRPPVDPTAPQQRPPGQQRPSGQQRRRPPQS